MNALPYHAQQFIGTKPPLVVSPARWTLPRRAVPSAPRLIDPCQCSRPSNGLSRPKLPDPLGSTVAVVLHDDADRRATVEAGGGQVWAESGACSSNRHNIGCSSALLFRHLADVVMLQILGCV